MEDWESELVDSFYRCHRGYLVNLEKITAYSVDTIDLINGDSLILAQKKYADFIKAYMRYAKDGGIVNV
jgi:DNA-binding LytR/AlgR family response regulator